MDPNVNEHLISFLTSLAIGLLIGVERERAGSAMGLRTSALAALFGSIAALVGPARTRRPARRRHAVRPARAVFAAARLRRLVAAAALVVRALRERAVLVGPVQLGAAADDYADGTLDREQFQPRLRRLQPGIDLLVADEAGPGRGHVPLHRAAASPAA